MTGSSEVWLALAAALALAWGPRALIAQAAGAAPSWPVQTGLSAALFVVGLGALAGGGLTLAVALMALAATAYFDLRFLLIPDLYVAALALAAAARALGEGGGGLAAPAAGAVLAGGLLAALRWGWRRASGEEGLGFGDVKLAAAIGGLLGPERALWVICLSAGLGAAWGLAARRRGALIPYGLFLALTAAALLAWTRP